MNTNKNQLVFLSKNEIIYGPYTPRDLEKLQQTEEWASFHWIYQEGSTQWLPLSSAPKELPKVPKNSLNELGDDIKVLCHNFKEAFSGVLTQFTSLGAEIPSDGKEESPLFEKGEKVVVNIFSEKLGKTAQVSAQIEDTYKSQKKWFYVVQWHSTPQLFSKS